MSEWFYITTIVWLYISGAMLSLILYNHENPKARDKEWFIVLIIPLILAGAFPILIYKLLTTKKKG